MSFHEICLQQFLLLVALIILAQQAAARSRTGCPDRCGSLEIPFPFGTKPGCYLDESFLITCNTSSGFPTPFLGRNDVTVQSISLTDAELRISTTVISECYNKTGYRVKNATGQFITSKFRISNTKNKFTAVGCDTFGLLQGLETLNYTTGCLSLCDGIRSVVNGSCSGIGCCQSQIPPVGEHIIEIQSFRNHTAVFDFNPCSYIFIVEETAYTFSSLDLEDFRNRHSVPMVLDWAVGNITCQEAKKNLTGYACIAENSTCYNSNNGPGYRCNCSSGYQGNPYLINGCQDIDECLIDKPCNGTCYNLPGSFSCSCPDGYEGDGMKNGTGCRPTASSNNSKRFFIPLGISIGLLVLLVATSWIYWGMNKRRLMKLKVKFFQQNGGLFLQQWLSNYHGLVEPGKIFTEEELKKATDNYDEARVLGQGGYGTVYKGMLRENELVAIKKSKIVDQTQIEQFINEVIVLSQINHRNVVKLLGCCLETEVPLLVYEFIANGTLSDHIHGKGSRLLLTWGMRLKIAAETAGAIAYLHSAASMPIIHRDVKTPNILLDDNCTAKVSDFGASRLVPIDHAQLTTLVQGTLGYLDPEYFRSSQLTEKSDVYSFGVVLAELLTGKKALSMDRPEQDRNLAMYFVSSMKEDNLSQILDQDLLVNEGNLNQIKDVAKLVTRCFMVKGEERPTMKEVAIELERLRASHEKHPWSKIDTIHFEETENLLGILSSETNAEDVGSSSIMQRSPDTHDIHNHIDAQNSGKMKETAKSKRELTSKHKA